METKRDQASTTPGAAEGVIELHRERGIGVVSLTAPDDSGRRWAEDIQVGPLRGHVRMRRGGYAKLQAALDGADLAFVASGRDDAPPLAVLTLDAYRALLGSGAPDHTREPTE